MNWQTFLLFLLAFASGTGMWISQKFLAGFSPYLVNGIAWLVLGGMSLILWYVFGWSSSQWGFHRAMIALGFSFLGLNLAYSMLYGQNIPVAYVPIIVTWVMTVTLWLSWYFFFGETITWKFIVWAVMILSGMGVMIMK